MRKALLGLMLILGAAVALSAQDKGGDKKGKDDTPKIDTTKIVWYPYDTGLKLAKQTGKHIMIDFTAKWCGYCRKMEQDVFSKYEVIKFLNTHFINIKVDGDSPNELNIDGYKITEKDLSRTEYRVSGYPTYWFLKSNSERIGGVSGYRPLDSFLDLVYYVKDDLYAKMKFDEYVKAGGRKKTN